jgi:hypothetical protein
MASLFICQSLCTALSGCVDDAQNAIRFPLYEMELSPMIVKLLTDDSFVAAALPLVGNIALCQSHHMDALIKCNLFDILKQFFQNGVLGHAPFARIGAIF